MALPDIRLLVPHAGPMVLLDRVLAADATSLCAEVTIRPDSVFCNVHDSGGGVGGWIGIEYMAQAIAAHAGYLALQRGEPVKVGFLLGARRYQCGCPLFKIGSVLQVHVEHVLQGENGLGSFECRITNQDEELAVATVTVFQPANVEDFLQGNAK